MKEIKNKEYSHIIPLWKFILFSTLTFNLYQYYWFYNNWLIIKKYNANYKNISPFFRVLCLFIPIYGFYIIYKQLSLLNHLFEKRKFGIGYLGILIIFISNISLSCLQLLPRPYYFLVALSFLPFIFIQFKLNKYLQDVESNLPKKIMSPVESIFILFGLFIWFFVIKFSLKLI